MKMGKRGLLVRGGVFLVVLLFVPSFGSITQAAPESIKISSVLSLTGPMSAMGTQIKPSYEIFADKVNAEGGIYVKEYGKKIPVELRILDDESDGLKTQAQLEVTNSWGAVANLGGLGCASFEMGTPVCMKNKMTWVGPGCGGWMPHQLGNEWLFSIFMKTPFFSPMVFDMILGQPGYKPKKVAIFEINELDAREAAMYWLQAAKIKGFDVVFHKRYAAGTKDFSALITGAKVAGAEILLAYPLPPMGPAIVKQMKELDFSPKLMYWVRAPEGAGFGPSLGELADYVTLPCAWSPKLKFPGNDYLNAQYEKKMGRPSDLIVGSAYSAFQVLAAGIEKAGTLDRTAIRDAVRATDMMTVCGPMRFTDQGWAKDRLLVVLQWMGGQQNIVYTNEFGKKFGDMVPVTPLKWQPKWSER
jgi:branched-chain amino acid transport system substrate-binding protein